MDEREEKKLNKRLADLDRQHTIDRDSFIEAAMATPQGRTFFYWLMEIGHVYRNPFTANALTTSFACGELNVGQQVQALLEEIVPAHYLHMKKERKEELENATRRNTTDDSNDSAD